MAGGVGENGDSKMQVFDSAAKINFVQVNRRSDSCKNPCFRHSAPTLGHPSVEGIEGNGISPLRALTSLLAQLPNPGTFGTNVLQNGAVLGPIVRLEMLLRPAKLPLVVLCLFSAGNLSAASVGAIQTAKAASDQQCTVTGVTSAFATNSQQIFARFVATGVRAGDSLRVEWISPEQQVIQQAPYEELPASQSLCFVSQMPIAGYEAAAHPGTWTVRVSVNDAVVSSSAFQITGDPKVGETRIQAARRSGGTRDSLEITLEGSGFVPGSVVHIAQFTKTGGWQYVAAGLASEMSPTRYVSRVQSLPPGEYVAVLKDPADRVSNSASFIVATAGSYKLPLPAGVPWRISQGPNGGFSHWGRTSHAFDIAPAGARCVVAMRAGIAHTFDFGYGQTPHLRIFGNYITIQHDNGEYSHYAHLQSGTLLVKTGQKVEQGQALAMAGNSGYSFGTHLHVQVTRAFQISAQSVPFEFEDLPNASRHRGVTVSSNSSPLCDCSKPEKNPLLATAAVGGAPAASVAPPRALAYSRTGSVPLADWWNTSVRVIPGLRNLEILVTALNNTQDVDLHLISPSGRRYGMGASLEGYTQSSATREEVQIPKPEPGTWRVSVQGVRTTGEAIPFRLEANTPLQ